MKVLQIKVYRGLKLSYNANGSPQNENQLVTLTEGRELDKFLGLIKIQGYCKVDLVSVKQKVGKSGFKDASETAFEKFDAIVKESFKGEEVKKVVTVDDLAKRLDELEGSNSEKDAEISALKAQLAVDLTPGKQSGVIDEKE